MKIRFIKMHAQGNDFIIFDQAEISLPEKDQPKLAKDVCNRHFGLGADGLVVLNRQDPEMVIYNADGSRAEICGSALRCCCRLIAEHTGKQEVQIKTDAGTLQGIIDSIQSDYVKVEMATPQMIQRSLTVDEFTGDYIKVANPHYVIVTDDLALKPHLQYGRQLSQHKCFEHGANIEFIKIKSINQIEMVVWERGVGATLACGSGSVASVFSGQDRGLLEDEVLVKLPGGEITITKQQNVYYLSGSTTIVAEGEFRWKV